MFFWRANHHTDKSHCELWRYLANLTCLNFDLDSDFLVTYVKKSAESIGDTFKDICWITFAQLSKD